MAVNNDDDDDDDDNDNNNNNNNNVEEKRSSSDPDRNMIYGSNSKATITNSKIYLTCIQIHIHK
jgi:hypothetical protein